MDIVIGGRGEPMSDYIRKQDVIKALDEELKRVDKTDDLEGLRRTAILMTAMLIADELPSVQPDLEEDEDIPIEYFENGGV